MRRIFTKKEKQNKDEKNNKNEENDVMQSIGSYHDFLIMEKKDRIQETILEFANVESENSFLKDFLILQQKPKPEQSRFSNLFKEISEKEKEKEKTEKIEEPKIIDNPNIISHMPNISSQSSRINSCEKVNFFSSNLMQNKRFHNININDNEKKKFNISNPNSRSTSEFSFFGHGSSFSSKSTNTNTNTYYKTSSSNSVESNIINFQGGGNINLIYNNPNNNINSNRNSFNFKGSFHNRNSFNNKNSINNINNNIIYIEKEKEFEPNVDIRKVLSLEDKRNTIMIKNIPNKFTREKLLELIDKNFASTYDLFILPKDGNKNRNFGYAFINFISSYSIPYFYFVFNGKKWAETNSQKVCEITYSKIQGRNELISHYPNKIIFFNDKMDVKNGNKFFIPNEYLNLFKQLFPNHPIEENNFGFSTKIPFIF